MIQVRQNMFETNSSSVHVLVMMKSTDFVKFHKNEEDYDNLEDIVFWKRYGRPGQLSSEQQFKTGKEFIDEIKSDGLIQPYEELDLKYLKKYANEQNYYTFAQTVVEMDDYDFVTEGDITAFSFSGRD